MPGVRQLAYVGSLSQAVCALAGEAALPGGIIEREGAHQ